jgi:hypothetical protein
MAVTLTITSTPEAAFVNGTTCRVWDGRTEGGARVIVFVAALGTTPESDAEAAAELVPLVLDGHSRAECEAAMSAVLSPPVDLKHLL